MAKHAMRTPLPVSPYLDARPVLTRVWRRLDVLLVGCGGTGSWLAPHLARLARELQGRGKQVHLLFVDPDLVEPKNVGRQHFCPAEVGRPKAATLAARYGAAYGLTVGTHVGPFAPALLPDLARDDHLQVLVGAVDNAAARQALAAALAAADDPWAGDAPPRRWWVDCVRFVPSKRWADTHRG